ncbi:MAG TPA: hypothetical protein VK932_23400 [Kofleriaceae bacterium]|nr:hypothetical protein [Kofleriaceae bacterium]
MHGLRLAASLSVLLLAPAALANPGAEPLPDGTTVVVVTPSAPVVFGPAPQPGPPGAAEMPPQPVAVAAAPAPQNEHWSNVSHINGRPVPVGERGNYLYKWKKTNIASNPIGWLLGFYGLSISQAVSNNFAIRGDGNLFREIEGDDSGYELGVTVPMYFKRVYQGPFIEPGLLIRDFDAADDRGAFVGAQVNVGWHWTFDSGMNVAFAVGAARRMNTERDELGYSSSASVEPTGYFRVGYAY